MKHKEKLVPHPHQCRSPQSYKDKIEKTAQESMWLLAAIYDNEQHRWELKVVAGVAFSLAVAIKRYADLLPDDYKSKKSLLSRARRYASECRTIFTRFPHSTFNEVSPPFASLLGVEFPRYFYIEYINSFSPEFRELLK